MDTENDDIPFKDKIKSINFGAPRRPRTKVQDGNKLTEQIHDTTGVTNGYSTTHPDGSVDMAINAGTAAVQSNTGS